MTFWDFLLSASSILFTAIITYIPLKFDIKKKNVHNIFIFFAALAVCTGVAATYNLWRENVKSDNDKTDQQKEFSKKIDNLKTNDSLELSNTRNYIVDSMTAIYKIEGERQKRQIDSLESARQRNLTNIDKIKLLKRLNDLITAKNLPKNIPVTVGANMGNEEARLFAHQVHDFIKSNGYNVIVLSNGVGDGTIEYTIGNVGKGFWIMYDEREKCISIDVGVIGNKP